MSSNPFADLDVPSPRTKRRSRSERRPAWSSTIPIAIGAGTIGVSALLLLIALGWNLAQTGGSSWKASSSRYWFVDDRISAQELFEAFDNPFTARQAHRRWAGSVLEVNGQVATVQSDEGGPYIIFPAVRDQERGPERPEDTWRRISAVSVSGVQGVKCYFPRGESIPLAPGALATIRGRCAGMPKDVVIRDCEIAQNR
jgi:hypothetical protein